MKRLVLITLYFLNSLIFAPEALDRQDKKEIRIYHFPQAKEELKKIANELQKIIDAASNIKTHNLYIFEMTLIDLKIELEDICDLLNINSFFLQDEFKEKDPKKIILFCSFFKEKFLIFASLYKKHSLIKNKNFDYFLTYSFIITKCPEFYVKILYLEKALSYLLNSNYILFNVFFSFDKFPRNPPYQTNFYFKKVKEELSDYSSQRIRYFNYLVNFENLRNLENCRAWFEDLAFAKYEFAKTKLLNFWIKINRDYVESMAYKACDFGILDKKHLENFFDTLFSNKYNLFPEMDSVDKNEFIKDWLSQVSISEYF